MLHSNLTEYLLRDVDLRYAGDIFQKFHSRRKPDMFSASDSLGTLETLALLG
jgi:hypothetical protein